MNLRLLEGRRPRRPKERFANSVFRTRRTSSLHERLLDTKRVFRNLGDTHEPEGRARHSVRAANRVFETVFATRKGLRVPPHPKIRAAQQHSPTMRENGFLDTKRISFF